MYTKDTNEALRLAESCRTRWRLTYRRCKSWGENEENEWRENEALPSNQFQIDW